MPKLGQYSWLPDVAFFLFPSEKDAEDGARCGGTGFLVAIPSINAPDTYHHIYAVTNWHVVCQAGQSTARINQTDGGCTVIHTEPSEWHFNPNGSDIAVRLMTELSPTRHKVEALNLTSFALTDQDFASLSVGPGDDVFMLGRFVDLEDNTVNRPALRFGHISIANVVEELPNGRRQRSHLLDMNSRSGFSGSPVFVYRTAGSIFAAPNTIMGGGHLLKLLGIHWGQYREKLPAELPNGTSATINGLSGMTCIAPAQAIVDLLNDTSSSKKRAEVEAALAASHPV